MYVGCLILTCAIAYRANQLLISSSNQKQRIGKFYILLIAVIFSTVAGLRDYSIGTDIYYYALPSFINAQRFNLIDYFAVDGIVLEPLYLILSYGITYIFNDFGVLLFALQMLTASFVLFRLCDYKYTKMLWLGTLIYNCFFFPISLNIMRQSIAVAIIFYGTRYLFGSVINSNIIKYIFFVVIAMCFHVSGAVGIVILFLYFFYNRNINGKKDKYLLLKTAILMIVMVVVVLCFDKIVDIIATLNGFSSKFSRYTGQNFSGFQLNPLLMRLPFLFIPLMFWGNFKKRRPENYLLFILILADFVFSELRVLSTSIYRISYYFAYFRMIEMPCLIESIGEKNRKILSSITIIICLASWAYQIVYSGNEGVFPYVFRK